MGRRSKAFFRSNCNQDLIENKENIKEFAMVKDNKKKSLKNSGIAEGVKDSKKNESIEEIKQKAISSMPEKVPSVKEEKLAESSNKVLLKQIALNKLADSTNVSKNKKTEKAANSALSHYSTVNTKRELKKQHSFEICPKCPVVVLQRIEFFDDDASSISSDVITLDDASDVILKDAGKAESGHSKSKNDLPKCECHSNLQLKEAVIVLEKLEFPENSISVFKDDGKVKEVPNKSGKGTKRKKEEKNKSEDKNSSESTKSKKQKVSNESESSKKEKIPDVTALDFSNDSKSSTGNSWNFKVSSWNINGIRAWLEKDGLSFLHHEQPDILCVQETKCSDDKLPDEVKKIDGYHTYWLAGDKDGYSGVGLLTKEKPIKVEYGIGISEHDNEGRVITAEYDKFYLVSTYVPNAGRGLVRLDYRMKWDKDFREYLKKLNTEKPIILTGDLNVAHEEIDLANPKTNKKNAGFTKEEREGFSTLLKEGFIDTFRHLYPNVKGAYTFWTYMKNARAKNVGWRLDYFVISERFTESLCDNVIRKDVYGSDHCPITLFLSL